MNKYRAIIRGPEKEFRGTFDLQAVDNTEARAKAERYAQLAVDETLLVQTLP